MVAFVRDVVDTSVSVSGLIELLDRMHVYYS